VGGGGTFFLPLMEKELMKTGMPNMLCCIGDLAMKAFASLSQQGRKETTSTEVFLMPYPKWLGMSTTA
jgi:hypothetical protein